jgi:ABC-2 type transport system ATP-binding protein
MKKNIVEIIDLTKKYDKNTVLDNINIKINKGDIYGLIGRNGAGKTTLMRIMTSLCNYDSGKVYLFGEENGQYNKNRIGSMIEKPVFYPNLSAYDNLKYYCIQKGIVDKNQINKVLSIVNLNDTGKKKFKNFSLGMKQRLGIALAILNNPDFIILDEPINGLDPLGISEIRDTLKKLNMEENITILISSHILSELYLVANKFCFIENSKIIKDITKEQLDLECNRCLVLKVDDTKKTSVILEEQLNTKNYKVIDKNEIRLYEYLDHSNKVSKILLQNDIELNSISEISISLEDYFKGILKESENNA